MKAEASAGQKALYTDEGVVRLVAAQVVVVTAVVLLTGWAWAAAVLVIDFSLRATGLLKSPFSIIADRVATPVGLERKPIFLPPKRFAAGIGLIFAIGILSFLLSGLQLAAYGVGGILIICALLESVFNYCLGCQVFHWITVLRSKFN